MVVSLQATAAAPAVFDVQELDTAIGPCADFDGFVNAKWIASHPIAVDRTRWDLFDAPREDSLYVQHRIVEVAAPFGACEPLPGKRVDGRLSMGENIGDRGGLNAAYTAVPMALAKNPAEAGRKIDGYTEDPRFSSTRRARDAAACGPKRKSPGSMPIRTRQRRCARSTRRRTCRSLRKPSNARPAMRWWCACPKSG